MKFSSLGVAATALAAIVAFAVPAAAQQKYPAKPVTLIVPYPAGGNADALGRLLASKAEAKLGQPIIVENVPGAGSMLGASNVARKEGDGYTILLGSQALASAPALTTVTFDPKTDLVPVAFSARAAPIWVFANKSLGVKSMKELVEYAKANAGKLSYGSDGVGSSTHVMMEHLNHDLKLGLVHIPYKGTAPSIQGLVSNEVQVSAIGLPSPLEFVKTGALVPLANVAGERTPPDMNLATVTEELGIKDFSYRSWWGILAPKGTPKDVTAALEAAFTAAVTEPDVKKTLEDQGYTVVGGTGEALGDLLNKESDTWKATIDKLGLRQ